MNSDKRLQHLIASYTNVLADSITNRDFFRYAKGHGTNDTEALRLLIF